MGVCGKDIDNTKLLITTVQLAFYNFFLNLYAVIYYQSVVFILYHLAIFLYSYSYKTMSPHARSKVSIKSSTYSQYLSRVNQVIAVISRHHVHSFRRPSAVSRQVHHRTRSHKPNAGYSWSLCISIKSFEPKTS